MVTIKKKTKREPPRPRPRHLSSPCPSPCCSPPTQSASEDAVPLRWQCPTAITTKRYTAKSDVYSFGVLLWEIYSGGATPYAQLQPSEVARSVLAGHRLARPRADTPEHILSIIRACTLATPESRPTMMAVHAQLSGSWEMESPAPATARRPPPEMAANALFQGATVPGDDDAEMESAL